jgi:hypothetical protein
MSLLKLVAIIFIFLFVAFSFRRCVDKLRYKRYKRKNKKIREACRKQQGELKNKESQI